MPRDECDNISGFSPRSRPHRTHTYKKKKHHRPSKDLLIKQNKTSNSIYLVISNHSRVDLIRSHSIFCCHIKPLSGNSEGPPPVPLQPRSCTTLNSSPAHHKTHYSSHNRCTTCGINASRWLRGTQRTHTPID